MRGTFLATKPPREASGEAAARDFKTIQHSHPSPASCTGYVNGRTLRGRGPRPEKGRKEGKEANRERKLMKN